MEGAGIDRRSQIAMAAGTLIAEYGYEATSVRQIADQVGMLPGSLYNHFATKEDILHEVMRARLDQLEQDNLKIARLPADAEHRLLANAIMRLHHYVEHWQFHTILLREGPFFQRHPDFSYVVQGKARISAVQASTLREGMEAGLFRPDMDGYLIIGTISRMLSGVTTWQRSADILSADRPAQYSLDALADYHFDCILRLVRTPARLAEPVPRTFCERLLTTHIGSDRCLRARESTGA